MPLGSENPNSMNWAQQVPMQRLDQRTEQRDSLDTPSRGDAYRVLRSAALRSRRNLPRVTRRGLSR